MSEGKNTRPASGEAGAPKNAEQKKVRYHVLKGQVPKKVVRTYFDPAENKVMDVVETLKVVKDRLGNSVEVVLTSKVVCQDEALQKKYVRTTAPQPVEDIIDV